MILFFHAVETAASTFELFFLIGIFNMLFPRRFSGRKWLGLCSGYFVSMLIIVSVLNNVQLVSYWNSILFLLLFASGTYLLFWCHLIEAVSLSTSFMLCLLVLDHTIYSLIGGIFAGVGLDITVVQSMGWYRIIWIFICKLIMVGIYFLLRYFLKAKKVDRSIYRRMLILALLGCVSLFFLLEITLKDFFPEVIIAWISLGGVFILFLLFVLNHNKAKSQAHQLQLLQERYVKMQSDFNSHAKLFHDMDNHINVLYQLMRGGENEEAQAYITDWLHLNDLEAQHEWTDIKVINIVLNTMYQEFVSHEIAVEFNIHYGSGTEIADVDICIILSNLLRNAQESCLKMASDTKRWIYVGIRQFDNIVVIKIENTFPSSKDGMPPLITSKEDRNMHGWGLKNVKNSIQTYNGTIKHQVHDQLFQTVVTLFTSER